MHTRTRVVRTLQTLGGSSISQYPARVRARVCVCVSRYTYACLCIPRYTHKKTVYRYIYISVYTKKRYTDIHKNGIPIYTHKKNGIPIYIYIYISVYTKNGIPIYTHKKTVYQYIYIGIHKKRYTDIYIYIYRYTHKKKTVYRDTQKKRYTDIHKKTVYRYTHKKNGIPIYTQKKRYTAVYTQKNGIPIYIYIYIGIHTKKRYTDIHKKTVCAHTHTHARGLCVPCKHLGARPLVNTPPVARQQRGID
jgi:hypothetical protein